MKQKIIILCYTFFEENIFIKNLIFQVKNLALIGLDEGFNKLEASILNINIS